jgi:hypothetical protein
MRAKIWAPGAGVIVLTSALVAGIPAAASAAPVTGPEDFTIVVTGHRPQLFTAEGTLTATGTAVEVISNGANGGVDEIQLPGGTFTLTLQNTASPTGGGGPQNPPTCVSTFQGTGISTISDGTGSFAGITGSGTYTFHGTFIGTGTPPNCSPRTIIDTVRDHGTVTLP